MPCLSVFRGPSGLGPARWSPPQHPRAPSPFSRSVNSPGAQHWGLGVPYILHRPSDSTPFKSLTLSSPPASRQPLPPADTCGGRPGTPLPPPHPETAVHVCPRGPRTRLREGTHREAIPAAEQKQGLPPEPSSEAQGLLFNSISSFHKLLLTETHDKKGIKREKSWWRNAFSFWLNLLLSILSEPDSTRGTCGRTRSSKLVPRDRQALYYSSY